MFDNVATRGKDNYNRDSTHVDYVLAVRHMAEKLGFAAFSKENSDESIIHYGPQNMVGHRSPFNSYKKCSAASLAKRPCYSWNVDAGYFRTEDE